MVFTNPETLDSSPSARLVQAARRHFLATGFRRVTMDDLADELGMSKKTLYACFPSKTDLVRAVILEKFAEADAEMGEVCSSTQDVPQVLARMVECIQRQT